MTKTKILIITDSAAIHTGLGGNCRMIFKDLLNRFPEKYEVLQLGWFHINPSEQVPWQIVPTQMNPKGNGVVELDNEDRYGQKSFEAILAKYKPDIVWCSGDIWCFEHLINSPNRNTFRLVLYYTIDGAPYFGTKFDPRKSSDWGEKLTKADEVVVWSEFGRETLKESCPELANKNINVIYHPMDLGMWRHLTKDQKVIERRRMYNPTIDPNAFILGYIGRNQFRKQNYKSWEVMHYLLHGDYIECKDCNRVTTKEWNWNNQTSRSIAAFKYETGYDYSHCWYCRSKNIVSGIPIKDIWFWQHIPATDPGYNIDLHLKMWNISDRIIRTSLDTVSKGMPPKQIADLISTWDGMLYLSGGEGFGIPAFEGQMSGLPIIYSNYSSHMDFCKHGGLPVRCDFIPEFAFAIHRSIADTNDAVKQILWAYRNRDDFAALGMQGRVNAMSHNVAAVTNDWEELFSKMMQKPISVIGGQRVYSTVI